MSFYQQDLDVYYASSPGKGLEKTPPLCVECLFEFHCGVPAWSFYRLLWDDEFRGMLRSRLRDQEEDFPLSLVHIEVPGRMPPLTKEEENYARDVIDEYMQRIRSGKDDERATVELLITDDR